MRDSTAAALLVTPTLPWEGTFGAQQRTALVYDALSKLMPVDVLLLFEGDANMAGTGDRAEVIAKLCWTQSPLTVCKYVVNSWANNWCHANIDFEKYALVVGRYLTPLTKIEWPRHLHTLVDCDDAFYRYAPKSSLATDRASAYLRSRARFWQTLAAIRKYDYAFFCSPRDQRMFHARASSILPNVVQAHADASAVSAGHIGTALIVGSMWYAPNRQGVSWFLDRCWPAIADRCPSLRLKIVGPASPGDRRRWSEAVRTEAPGFVDNLQKEYDEALFAIAPIQYGGGTCIKFLESAAFRRPCVVTKHVFAGFDPDFRDGESVMLAQGERGMVEACVALFEDAARRRSIADRAYEIVMRSYTVERFAKTVRRAVCDLLSSAPSAQPATS